MYTLLQKLKNPKNKISLILLAGIVLFMQCYLLQHKMEHLDHDHHHPIEHDSHEIAQDCSLCLVASQTSQFLLPTIHYLSLSLIGVFLVLMYHFSVIFSPAFLFPQTRAPPHI